MKIRTNELLEHCSPTEYCEIISRHEDRRTETVYYLLKKRLSVALRIVYEDHGFGLIDEFDDTIDDFFLYLYDESHVLGPTPFAVLERIRDKRAFFKWILSAYRIFLLNKAKETEREKDVMTVVLTETRDDDRGLSEELMMHFLATAIAFADQQFITLNRFVFYRMLLSFMDHRQAIPQEEMAKALNMNAVTYRVYTKRQKDRFLKFINIQESGGTLHLNPSHVAMRDLILSRFNQLYEVLMEYYGRALEELPNAVEVDKLRHEFSHDREVMMHEGTPGYGFSVNLEIRSFYKNMKDYLVRDSIGG
ncbi:MAG: hypothetical protein K6A28_03630 [Bacteroidales bacterium]|nr:hypothetical protein [Bacteroidales bacterium]